MIERISRSAAVRSLAAMVLAILISCTQGETRVLDGTPPEKAVPATPPDSFIEVSLLFAGDVMMHQPQISSAWNDSLQAYDFYSVFEPVAPIIKEADIAVANLETTFGGEPYTGYPQFSAPDTLAWALKQAGFDMIVTANNHTADRALKGIVGTIEGIERAGLPHTGSFRTQAEKDSTYPLIMESNGVRIAFLNYTYGTNGLPIPPPAVVNYIDTAQIRADIAAAHKKKADAVIVVYHWGLEYQREPNKEQRMLAQFALEQGADAIIGGHPHVLQPVEWMTHRRQGDTADRKGLVLYSLGNFVSNQRDRYKDGGMLFGMVVKKNRYTGKVRVERPEVVPTWVYKTYSPVEYYILPAARYVNDSTFIPLEKDRSTMRQFLQDTREHMLKDGVKEKD